MGDAEPAAVTIKAVGNIGTIDAAQWDGVAGSRNPFLSHAFLKALEDSGSVSAETGWVPYHVVVEGTDESLRAAAPLYVKSHSMGEYMFDYGWADAFERAGGQYYPKLQLAVPFTPVTGPRLLAREDQDQAMNRELALAGCVEVANQLEVSSLHITFLTEPEWEQCGDSGLLRRTGERVSNSIGSTTDTRHLMISWQTSRHVSGSKSVENVARYRKTPTSMSKFLPAPT